MGYPRLDSGPPFKKKRVVKESALPEPQLIKKEFIDSFFLAAKLMATHNYFTMYGRSTARIEMLFQREVVKMFLELSNKPDIQERSYFKALWKKILAGERLPLKATMLIFLDIGNILQELGPLHIEYMKSVPPEMSWAEAEILGED